MNRIISQKICVSGAVAQLGERQNRTLEVASSNLVCSIIPIFPKPNLTGVITSLARSRPLGGNHLKSR